MTNFTDGISFYQCEDVDRISQAVLCLKAQSKIVSLKECKTTSAKSRRRYYIPCKLMNYSGDLLLCTPIL